MTTALAPLLLILTFVAVTALWLKRLHVSLPDALQLLLQLRSPRLRRNHALEHATLNVLEERHGPIELVGHAVSDGFRIAGRIEPLELLDAAFEALRRLQRGESRLAIYSRCAPSLLGAVLLVAAALLVFVLAQGLALPQLALLLCGGLALLPGLSRMLQRFITTSTDVYGMSIEGLGPVREYLRADLAVSECIVRIRPRVRRIYDPRARYGQYAYANARVSQRNCAAL
jgi:hypothetical protein